MKIWECSGTIRFDDLPVTNTASLALALEVAGYVELDDTAAREIAAEVGKAVSEWRAEAGRHGLAKPELGRMASAFEYEDRARAQRRRPELARCLVTSVDL